MAQCIALLRGINVGRAKRIAMSELRDLFVALGFRNVRTLLNSGNVVFHASRPNTAKLAKAIEAAIAAELGVLAPVTVITAEDLDRIVTENPLLHVADDSSRHLVAFVANAELLNPLRTLLEESWAPAALAVGSQAAYLWCADGILEGKLSRAFARRAGSSVTTRNWATVLKLQLAANTVP